MGHRFWKLLFGCSALRGVVDHISWTSRCIAQPSRLASQLWTVRRVSLSVYSVKPQRVVHNSRSGTIIAPIRGPLPHSTTKVSRTHRAAKLASHIKQTMFGSELLLGKDISFSLIALHQKPAWIYFFVRPSTRSMLCNLSIWEYVI